MDHLAEHEAFLRAIYDTPDDDTPRLIYADFLEERGEPERAKAKARSPGGQGSLF